MILSHPEGFLEAREEHYQQFFGPLTEDVVHSTDIKPVHIDSYQFAPTADRPHWTLITSGMSDYRQIEPEECKEGTSTRAEILMYAAEPESWMFNTLKGLAEMPFDENRLLHWWHTVPNGMPMTAKPSLLTSFFFLPPYFEPEGFTELYLDGDRVDFLWLIPITEAERQFAVKNGSVALEKRFAKANLPLAVNESRKSIV